MSTTRTTPTTGGRKRKPAQTDAASEPPHQSCDDESMSQSTLVPTLVPVPVVLILKKTAARKAKPTASAKSLLIPIANHSTAMPSVANVILHLRCSLADLTEYNAIIDRMVPDPLKYNPDIPPEIQTYNSSTGGISYGQYQTHITDTVCVIDGGTPSGSVSVLASAATQQDMLSRCGVDVVTTTNDSVDNNNNNNNNSELAYQDTVHLTLNRKLVCQVCRDKLDGSTAKRFIRDSAVDDDKKRRILFRDGEGDNQGEDNAATVSMREIQQKLKEMKFNLYKNVLVPSDKKAACFWCTCEYDSPTCVIPKHEIDGKTNAYGSFCRPECAVAFLMNENIDDSAKFERYHLLNQIYGKAYNYSKNIKPAPNPHYLLDKFYGTLTIQEYRKLLRSDHLLLVIDKPITRILPELFEETEEFVLGVYGNKSSSAMSSSSSSSSTATPVSASVATGTGIGGGGGMYKVRRNTEIPQGPSKQSILQDKFFN